MSSSFDRSPAADSIRRGWARCCWRQPRPICDPGQLREPWAGQPQGLAESSASSESGGQSPAATFVASSASAVPRRPMQHLAQRRTVTGNQRAGKPAAQ